MMNVGNPEIAFGLAALPNDGVGLARMEFIIAESIKAHPMALIHPERVDGPARTRRDRAADGELCEPRRVFRAAPVGGRRRRSPRPSIRSRSSSACRISRPTNMRRCSVARLRAGRGQSDDRLSRRLALRASGLSRGLRARMRGDEARARRDGARQRQTDDSLLPARRGSRSASSR